MKKSEKTNSSLISLERFYAYARIDAQGEDAVITALLNAAEMTIVDKTGKLPPSDNDDLYCMAIMMLAAHWYDNRTPTETKAVYEIPHTMQMLITHIALCGRYPEVPAYEPYE
jgi:uncharacterized phage protein (predicted DNA packaging)|nr:MAG TPA: head tail connector [Caudoviricetes sp.]